jgi:Xaa-Pro aminopeptidase
MDPMLLMSGGDDDADFFYATGFPVESGVYIRYGSGDEVLVVPTLELERARGSAKVSKIITHREAGWQEMADNYRAWAQAAANLLRQRGIDRVRISPRLAAAYYEDLAAADIQLHVDREMFRAERRRKSAEEAGYIHAAQRAAEAACSEVIAQLGVSEVRGEILVLDGHPLTSERLFAEAQATLNEIGYSAAEMIIAGSPGSAMGHYRGEGPIRANAPVVIDIFPRGNTSRYYGDLTRTVVVGEASEEVRRMHAAVVAALDAAIAEVREGVNGRDVHRAVCRVLVEAGYGTTTDGFEGRQGRPRMNHSTGHGVGLDVHESPHLRDLDWTLQAGDVITIEPGLYQEGLGGVRVEDTGMVTKDGFKNFTSISRSLDPRAFL